MTRRRWGLLALPLLLGAGWWLLARGADRDSDWVEVAKQDLVLGVDMEGTLKAVQSSGVGPPQIGEIWDFKISFMAPEGQEVKKGEPILAFDTSTLDQQLQESLAEADGARTEYEKKKAELDLERRTRKLRQAEAEARRHKAALKLEVPSELASSRDLEETRRTLELAEEEIVFLDEQMRSSEISGTAELAGRRGDQTRAEQRVAQMRDAIDRMAVEAPRDGTVIYATNRWQETKKKPGDSCWRGEIVIEIPDLRTMRGEGEVDEADAGKVQPGQRVTLKLDAHPDVEFQGKVASIRRTVERQSSRNPLKVVRLDLELTTTDTQRMRPGMRFRGTVETARIPKVPVVPAQAVFPTQRGPVVFRKTRFGHEEVVVEVGRRNEEWVEIVSGLTLGDRVSRRDLATARGPEPPAGRPEA